VGRLRGLGGLLRRGRTAGPPARREAAPDPVLARAFAAVREEKRAPEDRQRRLAENFRDIDALRDRAATSGRTIADPLQRAEALVRLVGDCGRLRARAVRETYGAAPSAGQMLQKRGRTGWPDET
jgi:hypothetical protein